MKEMDAGIPSIQVIRSQSPTGLGGQTALSHGFDE